MASKSRELPHHRVFYLCEQAIIRSVKIEAVLHHAIEKKVIPESDIPRYSNKPKNGMKILIGYLKNRSFETFLDFVECILLAQGEDPSKAQSATVVDSIVKALEEFDLQNGTSSKDDVLAIQQKYMKKMMGLEELPPDSITGVESPQEEADEASHKLDLSSMPDNLDFAEEPLQESFRSEGGHFRQFQEYGFSLIVPPLAVPEGREINVKVGLCCYGPFSISDKYLLASDFAVIVADGKFSKPVKILMEHCLILPEYKKCSEVVILRADHRKVTKDGLYTFDKFTIPEIDSDSPTLSFESTEFCILCAVLEKRGQTTPFSPFSSTSSDTHGTAHIDDLNPSSAASSFERSLSAELPPTLLRTISLPSDSDSAMPSPATRKRRFDSLESDQPESTIPPQKRSESSTKTRRMIMKTRRRSGHHTGGGSVEKKHSTIEYAALLLQPTEDKILKINDLYRFMILICTNCPVAYKKCTDHAKERLRLKDEEKVVPPSPVPIIISDEAVLMTISKCRAGWAVEPDRTPKVSVKDLQFNTMNRKDLFALIEQKMCPPGIVYSAECESGTSRRFSCKVVIEGATTMGAEVFFNISAEVQQPSEVQQPPAQALLRRQDAMDQCYGQPGNHQYPPIPHYGYPPQLGHPNPLPIGAPPYTHHPALQPSQPTNQQYSNYPYQPQPHPPNAPPNTVPFWTNPATYASNHASSVSYGPDANHAPVPYQHTPFPNHHTPVPNHHSTPFSGHHPGVPPNHTKPHLSSFSSGQDTVSTVTKQPTVSSDWNSNPGPHVERQLSQDPYYSDSPLTSLDPQSPLSYCHDSPLLGSRTQSQEHEFQVPPQPLRAIGPSKSQQDSSITSNLHGLSRLSLSQPLHLDTSVNRMRSGSSGSQGSPKLNVSVTNLNIVQLVSPVVEKDLPKLLQHDLSHYESQLSPDGKDEPVQDKYIQHCAGHFRNWKEVARGFGLDEGQISVLESDHVRCGTKECAYQAYLMWKMENGYTATRPVTVWQLVQLLHGAGEADAIDHLIEQVKEDEVS